MSQLTAWLQSAVGVGTVHDEKRKQNHSINKVLFQEAQQLKA